MNAPGEYGTTPLMRAAERHRTSDLAQLLLTHGADPNAKDWEGNTALHSSLQHSHGNFPCSDADLVRVLLKYGADAAIANKGGYTPLHFASMLTGSDSQMETIVALLLQGGANPLYRSTYGETPLDDLRAAKTDNPVLQARQSRLIRLLEAAVQRANQPRQKLALRP